MLPIPGIRQNFLKPALPPTTDWVKDNTAYHPCCNCAVQASAPEYRPFNRFRVLHEEGIYIIFIASVTSYLFIMANALPALPAPDSVIISFLTLRKIVGLLGVSLVPVLVLGSFILDDTNHVQISVSAYYYTSMRNALVGIACGISLFLLSYHGYTWKDSLASKLAGLFELGIAFFPTSATNDKSDILSTLHYLTSGVFFAILSYMSIFLFTKSSGVITPQKRRRNRIYRICGIIMLVSVAGIPVTAIPAIHHTVSFLKPTLILETAALVSFGFSWLTKGQFLLKD